MNKLLLGSLAVVSTLWLASCTEQSHAQKQRDNPNSVIVGDTKVIQVCMNKVAYWATGIRVDNDSIASRAYWIIGGMVMDPRGTDGAAPKRCEQVDGTQLDI